LDLNPRVLVTPTARSWWRPLAPWCSKNKNNCALGLVAHPIRLGELKKKGYLPALALKYFLDLFLNAKARDLHFH
jgi:hypothetical protein